MTWPGRLEDSEGSAAGTRCMRTVTPQNWRIRLEYILDEIPGLHCTEWAVLHHVLWSCCTANRDPFTIRTLPLPPSPTPHSNYSLYTVFGPVVDDTLHTAPVVGCDDVSNPVWYTSSPQLPMATYPPTLSTLTLTLRFSLLLIQEVCCTTPKKHEQQRPLVSNVGQ